MTAAINFTKSIRTARREAVNHLTGLGIDPQQAAATDVYDAVYRWLWDNGIDGDKRDEMADRITLSII